MPSFTLTNEQVVELVKQLPSDQQIEVFSFLLLHQWEQWESLSKYGSDRARLVAQERGQDWNVMTEDERESFVNEVVNED